MMIHYTGGRFVLSRWPCVLRVLVYCAVLLGVGAGCAPMVVRYLADTQQGGDRQKGITFYVGGAGPIGHVGSMDVPGGLHDAGYEGYVEVFAWQGMTHAGDQMNLRRNRHKAVEMADRIVDYARRNPDGRVHIIALSAGTGIAAFALEALPPDVQVENAVFLACSLSSRYDLAPMLERIRGGLYVVYSPWDRILNNVVWYTGTVDRSSAVHGVAGLEGFRLPARMPANAQQQYQKLHNIGYRLDFAETGYGGGHTDSTSRMFIRDYVAGVILGDDRRLLNAGATADAKQDKTAATASRPTSRPSPDRP